MVGWGVGTPSLFRKVRPLFRWDSKISVEWVSCPEKKSPRRTGENDHTVGSGLKVRKDREVTVFSPKDLFVR